MQVNRETTPRRGNKSGQLRAKERGPRGKPNLLVQALLSPILRQGTLGSSSRAAIGKMPQTAISLSVCALISSPFKDTSHSGLGPLGPHLR